ncbi:hypothetical protein OH77DRAFT_1054492 [Trametes cingulata]|nr:hypothetical protein OH77DRAFT_1054492 [Trametes cingulata]
MRGSRTSSVIPQTVRAPPTPRGTPLPCAMITSCLDCSAAAVDGSQYDSRTQGHRASPLATRPSSHARPAGAVLRYLCLPRALSHEYSSYIVPEPA